jgi:hypothetical protein
MSSIQQDILWDYTNNKRSLISESVTASRICVHPAREEPDQHIACVASQVSHTTTVGEVPTKSKLGPCSWDDVLAPSDAWPGHHTLLPHSPSIKPPRSREVQFDELVTGLLSLPGPINQTCGQYKTRLAIGAKTTRSLIDASRGYHLGTSEDKVIHFPLFALSDNANMHTII